MSMVPDESIIAVIHLLHDKVDPLCKYDRVEEESDTLLTHEEVFHIQELIVS
jgi:hypothetical protein